MVRDKDNPQKFLCELSKHCKDNSLGTEAILGKI